MRKPFLDSQVKNGMPKFQSNEMESNEITR